MASDTPDASPSDSASILAGAAAAVPSVATTRIRRLLALNAFALCKCLRALGNAMMLVVLGMCSLSYYAVVAPMLFMPNAILSPNSTASAAEVAGVAIAAVIFHVAMAMLLWSYFAAAFTDPGRVPHGWTPYQHSEAISSSDDDNPTIAGGQAAEAGVGTTAHSRHPTPPVDVMRTVHELAASGNTRHRFCRKCGTFKPHRAHHDSVLGHCVLKMDHYCVWVANTVGLLNYKFFLLFLVYTFIACTIAVAMLVSQFAEMFGGKPSSRHHHYQPSRREDRHDDTSSVDGRAWYAAIAFFAFVIDLAFAVSVFAFMVMHIGLVSRNMTTIEAYEKHARSPWIWDKGLRKNLAEVFGDAPWAWFLPLHAEVWQASRRRRMHASSDDEAVMAPLTRPNLSDASSLAYAAMIERHLCDLHGSRVQSADVEAGQSSILGDQV